MKVELKKFGLIGHLRILLTTLDKDYSKERQDTFFSYLKKSLKSLFIHEDIYEFRIIVDGKFVGNIGLFNSKGSYVLGYFILRESRNKGITSEAVRILLNKCGELKIKEILSFTDIQNKASQRVLEKNGFKILKKDKKKIVWKKKL